VDHVTLPADPGSFFDREAGRYDAAHDRAGSAVNALWIRMSVVLRLLGAPPGSVVDCGMGPGRLLAELDQRGWSVAGIDVSGEMVSLACARLPEAADRLLQGRMESLPFSSGSFDAAVCTGVLEYVEDVPRALSEVDRVLRRGGVFVVSMPNTRALGTLWRQRVLYTLVRAVKERVGVGRRIPLRRPGLLSFGRLRDRLAEAGLEVERVEYISLAPPPLRGRFPAVAVRVARMLDRVDSRTGRRMATQYVVAARKKSN
jgi:ubiquinone/menaquinone biosynthesis C-methylase UbiE